VLNEALKNERRSGEGRATAFDDCKCHCGMTLHYEVSLEPSDTLRLPSGPRRRRNG
jgi:hypothetical protein